MQGSLSLINFFMIKTLLTEEYNEVTQISCKNSSKDVHIWLHGCQMNQPSNQIHNGQQLHVHVHSYRSTAVAVHTVLIISFLYTVLLWQFALFMFNPNSWLVT